MTRRYYFLDWCPRISASQEIQVIDVNDEDCANRFLQFAALRGYPVRTQTKCISLSYSFRNDGIFIFCAEFANEVEPYLLRYISAVLTYFVKQEMRHTHHTDRNSISGFLSNRYPVKKTPVLLPRFGEGDIINIRYPSELLSDDKLLCSLAVSEQRDDQGRIIHAKHGALLLVRKKFVSLFDRTFLWIGSVKKYSFFGLPIYNSLFLYILTYLCFSFLIYVHLHFAEVSEPDYKFSNVYFAGSINAVALIGCFWIFVKVIKNILSSVYTPVYIFLREHLRVAFFARYGWYVVYLKERLPARSQLLFFLLVCGPFIFSLKEMPTAYGLIRLGKLDTFEEILSKMGIDANIANVYWIFDLPFEDLFFGYVSQVFYLPFIVVALSIYYILDISIKRRRVTRALRGLLSFLRYGAIFDSVISASYARAGQKFHVSDRFEIATKIVADRLNYEERKRIFSQLALCLILTVSVYVTCFQD